MATRTFVRITALIIFAALAVPLWTAAQENSSPDNKPKHKKYKLVDLGTFGGAQSFVNSGISQNSRGDLIGSAETLVPLNQYSNGFPCFPGPNVNHAFRYHDGLVTDLGALPPSSTNCSNSQGINDSGEIAGVTENGVIDPVLGVNEIHGFVLKNGYMVDIGALGGNVSIVNSINDRGQVVGFATNAIPDPYSIYYFLFGGSSNGTQTRAYLRQNGTMQDLGTLGGSDAWAEFINNGGQISGYSYTNDTPNPTTGIPTIDPFLWEKGKMIDLGTLGGTSGGPYALNNRGQVVGVSNLPGDSAYHAFFWERGVLRDLGTFGGDTSEADALNNAGEVVGVADFSGDQVHDGFLWKKGVMTDLGNLGKTSHAWGINSSGQIVGASRINDAGEIHAFLWKRGGNMVDLNDLIPLNSGFQLYIASALNDEGVIAGNGLPTGCDNLDVCGHAYLLIPDGDCDEDNEARMAATQNRIAAERAAAGQHLATTKPASESQLTPIERIRSMMRQRYHMPSQPAAPRD